MLGVAWKRIAALNRRYSWQYGGAFCSNGARQLRALFSTANLDNEKNISKERKLIKDVTKGQMSYLKNISLKSLDGVDSDIIFEYVPNNGVIKVFGTDPLSLQNAVTAVKQEIHVNTYEKIFRISAEKKQLRYAFLKQSVTAEEQGADIDVVPRPTWTRKSSCHF